MRRGLEVVASDGLPWTAWGMNYAELALAMFGFHPSTRANSSDCYRNLDLH